jgi:myo-inositol-1(or 4)-monophosphatase
VASYRDLLPPACAAMDLARELFLTCSPGRVTTKGERDMASEVDYAIERRLAEYLRQVTPDIGFLGEEDGLHGDPQDLTWVLDPVDGTVNFIHGSPLCGISLALLHDRSPVVGVVDLPHLGLRYTASVGTGAYCGDRRLAVSSATTLVESVVAIGDYAVGAGAAEKNRVRLAITERLAASAQRVRMHGSAAIDLVWVAEGRVDGLIMMSNNPWDTAAGVVIAREAGALVVDRDGAAHTMESSATIAANPALIPVLVQVVTEASASG